MRPALPILIALFLLAPRLAGQTLVLDAATDDRAALIIEHILRTGNYLQLERDTVLGPEVRLSGDLLVVGARVTLEGRIDGSVGVVEGDFFVRPRGRVAGPVAVIGRGGAYASGLAEVGEIVHLDHRIGVRLEREDETTRLFLVPPPPPRVLRLPDLYGISRPEYDRVNSLSLRWGAQAGFGGADPATVLVGGTLTYRTGRNRVDPTAEIAYRPSQSSLLTLAAGRRTRTTDSWIRGDLANSLTSLGVASDVRDYFESDELSLTFARVPPPPIIQGEWFVAPVLSARLSRDRSLPALAPWSLFGSRSDWRLNPPVDEGTLASLVAGGSFGWKGTAADLSGAAAVEWAPAGIGDFEFAQASAMTSWWMRGLWDHQIRVQAYLLHPLGAREAPLQRWSFVGGPATLPTFDTAQLRGDHLVLVNSVYFAPVPGVQIPLLGQPAMRLEHSFGTAWRTGDPVPPLEQNVGIGIQLLIFNAMIFIDPAERPRRFVTSVGARLPASISLPIL